MAKRREALEKQSKQQDELRARRERIDNRAELEARKRQRRAEIYALNAVMRSWAQHKMKQYSNEAKREHSNFAEDSTNTAGDVARVLGV